MLEECRRPVAECILSDQFRTAIQMLQKEDHRMPDVALGYAYYDAETSHIQNTVEKADAMMYQNKKTGGTTWNVQKI